MRTKRGTEPIGQFKSLIVIVELFRGSSYSVSAHRPKRSVVRWLRRRLCLLPGCGEWTTHLTTDAWSSGAMDHWPSMRKLVMMTRGGRADRVNDFEIATRCHRDNHYNHLSLASILAAAAFRIPTCSRVLCRRLPDPVRIRTVPRLGILLPRDFVSLLS